MVTLTVDLGKLGLGACGGAGMGGSASGSVGGSVGRRRVLKG